MLCPFCTQWNQDGERRCVFCNNLLQDDQDRTSHGRPAYEDAANTQLPDALRLAPPPPPPGDVKLPGLPVKFKLGPDQMIGVGVGILVVIILLASHCG